MAAKRKPYVKLQCEVCKKINYYTRKSRQKMGEKKLGLKKFCRWCRKHTSHKECRK